MLEAIEPLGPPGRLEGRPSEFLNLGGPTFLPLWPVLPMLLQLPLCHRDEVLGLPRLQPSVWGFNHSATTSPCCLHLFFTFHLPRLCWHNNLVHR